MSWFDTSRLATMANKAMKEAQKTLDSALDIAEEQSEEEKNSALWSVWKTSSGVKRTESDSQIADKQNAPQISGSVWGSFSGSFFDAESVSKVKSTPEVEPVSCQPKRVQLEVEEVTDSSSSVLGGVEEKDLAGSWEEDRFTSSRLVVQDREGSLTPEGNSSPSSVDLVSSPSIVELASSSASITRVEATPSGCGETMASVELHSPQSSLAPSLTSSVELLSPPSRTPSEHQLGGESSSIDMVSSSASGDFMSTQNLDLVSRPSVDLPSPSSVDQVSPSIELVSPSIELVSPSIELVSPSIDLVSQSSSDLLSALDETVSPTDSIEVVTSPSVDLLPNTNIDPVAASTKELVSSSSVEQDSNSEGQSVVESDLTSSVSSGHTVVVGELGDRLAEAMVEEVKSVSPSSSSRSSEIVKIGSLAGSEVTSCDELEEAATATSSDIEVLSYRRHARGGSDQSSVGEEMESLRRKARELEELVAAREARLMAVSKEMATLQGEVEESKADRIIAGELRRRVGLLEAEVAAGVQQAERQAGEMEKLKKAAAMSGSDDEDKDEIISDLRSEGEALARQNGKQAETIRKLRAKEKTIEGELSKYKTEAEKNKTEVERLNKNLAAKNSVEGNQCEVIKNLTEANQAWEAENKQIKNDLEDNVEKVAGLRKSLEGAYKEMSEMKRKLEDAAGEAAAAALSREVTLRKEAVAKLEEEERLWSQERSVLEGQVGSLQGSLAVQEQAGRSREELYKQEVAGLRLRLEQSDTRHEDLAESVGLATKPLLRQIETLQANMRESVAVQEQVESQLNTRLQQTSSHLAAAQERERAAVDQYRTCSSRIAGLEVRLEQEEVRNREMEDKITLAERQNRELEDCKERLEREMESVKKSWSQEVTELTRDKQLLNVTLETEKAESESRRRKALALVEQLKERDRRVRELQAETEAIVAASHSSSPTPSLSRLSTTGSDSFSREPWPEDVYTGSSLMHTTSLYETQGRLGSTASLMETLQAQLKQREGELAALQAEVANMNRVKEAMSEEMTKLTIRSEQADQMSLELSKLKEEFQKLQKQYQTMLTMYGEKMEEAEELRLDLQDVKEMYRMQIVQLTGEVGQE